MTMAQTFEWNRGFFSLDTREFDRALYQFRDIAAVPAANPALLANLATELKGQVGITRREFDRRFRLIVSAVIERDASAVTAIATHLSTVPETLNSLRSLLPPEMRHLAIPARTISGHLPTVAVCPSSLESAERDARADSLEDSGDSKYKAVVLIGTEQEHVRNDGMLRAEGLDPLRLPSLEPLWNIAPTGLCGFIVGASAWGQIPEAEQRVAVRRICEYSTFLFARVCLDGLAPAIAQTFIKDAAAARCGFLDASRFCHGQDCDLSLADIQALQSTARLLEKASRADFFPLGLSENDASLLRLIAAERHQITDTLVIRKLGTRELAGGRSAARVFLLSDGRAQPFVAKLALAEELAEEHNRYARWIQYWEPLVTNPTFHAHQGSAAISFRLHSAADGNSRPAPTLEDCLEGLRSAEWSSPIEEAKARASDLFHATSRAIDRLVELNSREFDGSQADDFWLPWPIKVLASRGIEITVVNREWETIQLSDVVAQAHARLKPNLTRGVVHGDIHGRNILLLDRLPAFIDFRWSGGGHPLVDLVRLDATVRSIAMRMVLPKQSMFDVIRAIYVEGREADDVLANNAALAASPLTELALRVAAKTRQAAIKVAEAHSIGMQDFYAMTCVVSAHVLAVRTPGSGVERLLLGELAAHCNGSH
jgi:hypothetical protein